MPSDNDIVQRFTEIIKQASPSVTRSPSGISITQGEQTYEIPFRIDATSVAKVVLLKK
jgi:hypothetical protein